MSGTSGSIGNGILGEYFPEREYNLLGPKKTRKRPKFQPCFSMSQSSRSAGHISAMPRLPNVPAKPVCRTYLSYAPASQCPSHAGLQDISQLCPGFSMSQPSRSAGHISAMPRLPNVPAKPVCRTYLSYAQSSQCPSQAGLQDIFQLCPGFSMSQPSRSAGHISAMPRLHNVPATPVCRTYLSYAPASQCPSQAGLQDISQLCPGFSMSQPRRSAGHISAMPRLLNVPATPVCRTYLSYALASQCPSQAGLQDISQLCPGFSMSQPSRSAGHISAMPRLLNVPAKPVCSRYGSIPSQFILTSPGETIRRRGHRLRLRLRLRLGGSRPAESRRRCNTTHTHLYLLLVNTEDSCLFRQTRTNARR